MPDVEREIITAVAKRNGLPVPEPNQLFSMQWRELVGGLEVLLKQERAKNNADAYVRDHLGVGR